MVVDSSNTALRDNEIRSVSAPEHSPACWGCPSQLPSTAEDPTIDGLTSPPFADVPEAAQFLHRHHV